MSRDVKRRVSRRFGRDVWRRARRFAGTQNGKRDRRRRKAFRRNVCRFGNGRFERKTLRRRDVRAVGEAPQTAFARRSSKIVEREGFGSARDGAGIAGTRFERLFVDFRLRRDGGEVSETGKTLLGFRRFSRLVSRRRGFSRPVGISRGEQNVEIARFKKDAKRYEGGV